MYQSRIWRGLPVAVGLPLALLMILSAGAAGAPGFRADYPADSADLSMVMTADPSQPAQGARFSYVLKVANDGPSPATEVNIDDPLPSGVRFVSVSSTQGACTESPRRVMCAVGTLAAASTATVTITMSATQTGSITNTGQVTGREYDPYESNNTASVTTNTLPQATTDLAVTNTADPQVAQPGQTITYTVTATNRGPSPATGVVLKDQLPAGAQLVSATPSQGTCTPGQGEMTCALGDLPSGSSATVTVTVTTDQLGRATNTASVSGNEFDPDGGNNQASATTEVQPVATTPSPGPTPSPSPDIPPY